MSRRRLSDSEPSTNVNVRVPVSVFDRLDALARQQQTNIRTLVRTAIARLLAEDSVLNSRDTK